MRQACGSGSGRALRAPRPHDICSVLNNEPCRVQIANASQASLQLLWYSYKGAGASC